MTKTFKIFLAVSLAVQLIAADLACATTLAGNFTGEASVTKTGSFKYSLKIDVPAGIDGLQPELAVIYDSQTGNGILGRSMSLAGISSVQRCIQTKRIDGEGKPVSLSTADRFCVDGQRLVLNGATKAYGAEGAEYRTEFDQFSKITSSGYATPNVQATGPQQFTMDIKAGINYQYGFTPDSRQLTGPPNATTAAPASILSWSINQAKDLIGNTISYSYTTSAVDGSQYLSQITYNGGKAYIKFTYTDDSLPSKRYLGGGLVTRSKLLQYIKAYVLDGGGAEQLVSQYQFGYVYGDLKGDALANSVAMLGSVEKCGSNGTDCLPKLTFGWSKGTTATAKFNPSQTLVNDGVLNGATNWPYDPTNGRRFADLSGNGILNIVGFGANGVYTANTPYPSVSQLSLANFGTSTAGWIDYASSPVVPKHLIDMNNDGFPDIVAISTPYNENGKTNPNRGLWISYFNPTIGKFSTANKIPNGEFYTDSSLTNMWAAGWADLTGPRYLFDMNKDGYPDLIGINGNRVYLSTWNGTSLSPARDVTSPKWGWSYSTNGACCGSDVWPTYLQDMNGDGYPDLVGVQASQVVLVLWDPILNRFSDTMTVVSTKIGGGNLNAGQGQTEATPVWFVDMNGDGYPDLVKITPTGMQVSLWNGKNFNDPVVWTSEFVASKGSDLATTPIVFADVDSDGLTDLVAFRNDGVHVALSNGNGKLATSTIWSSEFKSNSTDILGNKWQKSVQTPRHAIDLDGDGSTDIVGFGNSSLVWAKQMSAPGVKLVQVTDSLGATTKIQYTILQTRSSFYKNDSVASVWPIRDGQGSTMVVSEISRDSGLTGQPRTTRYRYEGRKFHFDDGPLGFHRIYERDQLTGVEKVTEFSQQYPLIGQVLSEKTYASTLASGAVIQGCVTADDLCLRNFTVTPGQTLSAKTFNQTASDLDLAGESSTGFKRKFIYLGSLIEENWDLDGTKLPTKTTTDAYDEPVLVAGRKQYGNRTSRTVLLDDGHKTTVTDAFEAPDEVAWKIGRLSTRGVASERAARSIAVAAPTDAAPLPSQAGPKPISPAVLSVILSILLDD